MRSLIDKSFAIAIGAVLAACAQPYRHVVGPEGCRFSVPSNVRALQSAPIRGTDSSVASIYLAIPVRTAPTASNDGNQPLRVIVSCESTPEPDVVVQLRESGVGLPIRATRQAGSDLYRIYKASGNSSWVLTDFVPQDLSTNPRAGRILAHCYLASASSRDKYGCVHSARHDGVRIEYRFGPSSVGFLDDFDRNTYSMLERMS